jgi:hypothetical protein
LIVSSRAGAQVQQFSSGSTGADGALNITAPGVTYLDPKAMNINANGDNIFNFTTINIASGSILKISEAKVHGPVYFLAQGDVTITGVIDLRGDDSPGPTATAAEQIPAFAGSGGYSGGLGGIHADTTHQALPGNGPGGGAAGDISSVTTYAGGGSFTTNRFLVPLVGGSGGGGTNLNNGQYGPQGGAGAGALLITSSTTITLGSTGAGGFVNGLVNGVIYANGGSGGAVGCGGAGGAVRLVANSIVGVVNNGIQVGPGGGSACRPGAGPQNGFARLEANSLSWSNNFGSGPFVSSVPFSLNLPTTPAAVITVASINGIAINANPFSFPDATINSATPVPVVINATNVPLTATVTLFLLSDTSSNQSVPVTLQGTAASSTATVQVTFASGGTRGFVKAAW